MVGLLQLEKHGGIRVLVRKDLYGRSVSIVVALPRDRFNAALRKRLQQFFQEKFHGVTVDYHLSLGETESARIFFTVHVEAGHADPRGAVRDARGRGGTARAHVGRRPARCPDRPRGPPEGHGAGREVLTSVPRLLQGVGGMGSDRRRRAGARDAGAHRGRLPGRHRERERGRATHAREAVQDGRQGRSLRLHADPRSVGPAGGRGDPDAGSWARARSTSTTSGCWTAAVRCWNSAPRPSMSRTPSPRSGADRSSPTR